MKSAGQFPAYLMAKHTATDCRQPCRRNAWGRDQPFSTMTSLI